MSSEPDAFALLTASLMTITDKVLQRVDYWVLDIDVPDFDVDAPNLSGLCTVSLIFDTETLEIFPFWDRALRDQNTYHVQVQRIKGPDASPELTQATRLVRVCANNAILWRNAIAQRLIAVTVYGIGRSPQAIRFTFPMTSVIVSVGYSGETPLRGDGDEIVLFSPEQWSKAGKTLPDDLVTLWEMRVT